MTGNDNDDDDDNVESVPEPQSAYFTPVSTGRCTVDMKLRKTATNTRMMNHEDDDERV